MSKDPLDRAVQALREEIDAENDKLSRATRARLLARASSPSSARQWAPRRMAWAVAAFAVVGMPVTWAAATGRLAPVVDAIARTWRGDAGGDPPPRPPAVAAAAAHVQAQAATAPLTTAPLTTAPAAAPPKSTTPARSRVAPRVANDPGQALFREAHELHFRSGDATAAIAAWDRYLAFAPNGAFAVEARYNRALALLRAGRSAEAAAALVPYATGKVTPAGYRQVEAAQLLALLRAADAEISTTSVDSFERPEP